MNFTRGKIREFYLLTTDIENIFINEYMPAAPGDYVKVYLYGLMYAGQQEEMTHEGLARQLCLDEEKVNEAWNYWAGLNLVRKIPNGKEGIFNYDIEFVDLRELMYGITGNGTEADEARPQESEESAPEMPEAGELKAMTAEIERSLGRTLSAAETQEIFSWITDLHASPEIIVFAYDYYCGRGKTNVKYIAKVIMQWVDQGFKAAEDARKFLDERDERSAAQKRILQSLGLNRNATEAEKEMINRWFDDMHFNLEMVLNACDRTISIPNPNLRYVNKILENWYEEAKADGRDVNKKATVTQAVLNQYYEYLRKKAEREAQERKEQVYASLPRIEEIDEGLTDLGRKVSRLLVAGGDNKQLSENRKMMEMMEAERAVLLTENNFPIDYTDIKYSCDLCKDTGLTDDGQRCRCTEQRMEEAEIWQKTN